MHATPRTLWLIGVALVLLLVASVTSGTSAQTTLQALPSVATAPSGNPTTPARVALGRLLFWDPILSGNKDVACATCHHPAFGYADGRDLPIGANGLGLGAARTFAAGHAPNFVKRNSPTVINTAFNGLGNVDASPLAAPMFWDLRVRSLEAQALEPIKSLDEMRGGTYGEDRALAEVVARLDGIAEYRRFFADAFGGATPVTDANLGKAIAAFERTLIASNSPFDRYMRGDAAAMTPAQVRGMARFQSAGCAACHSGPMFSDFTAHVLAVPDNPKLAQPDTGVNQTYAFRTPSLRNLSLTAPFMHNGIFTSLNQVVNFYERVSRGGGGRGGGGRGGRGGGGRGNPALNPQVGPNQIDPLARALNMRGRGQGDLIAFLDALNDSNVDATVPARVPSGLPVGGRLQQ